MLMTVTVFPVVGFPSQTGEVNNPNFSQPLYQAPTPKYAQIPSPEPILDIPIICEHPEKTAATMDNIVRNMLEQVDETIYLCYLENLTAFGPRYTGSDACHAAAEYIYNQFEIIGLVVRYHHWGHGDNVEATINGTDESSDEIYIICAHYDTPSLSPGADDDASGTVAVLMTAFIMSQSQYKFNYTIKFVVFSGEEQGMLGSQVYVADAADEGWNIVGVLNADMISYAETTSDGNNLIVFENGASEWLYDYTLGISIEYADYIQLGLSHGGSTWGSDHYYFWREGYSALFYFESTETPFYHTSNDTIAHINATYAVKNIRLMLATLAELSEVSHNNPPAKPVLTGASSGVINQAYNLSVVTTEPDGEDVYFLIDWGDGQVDEWVGPFNSGAIALIAHQWVEEGNYTIQVKAKDIFGAESDWGTLEITMPTSYKKPMLWLREKLIEWFPDAFLLLRHLIRY